MFSRYISLALTLLILQTFNARCWAQASSQPSAQSSNRNGMISPDALNTAQLSPIPKLEGVQFLNNSSSQILLEKDGKQYLIDTQTRTIHEVKTETIAMTQEPSSRPKDKEAERPSTQASQPKKEEKEVYYTEDLVLWNLPTAHHLEKNALIVDFTHRFSYNDGRVFTGPARASYLFGLDGYSISSFGFTYGITNTFFAGIYRVPTALGRIIQLSGGAQISQESKGHPFSSTFRVAVEGANHFSRNYVTSLEFALARSIKKRAQIYFVPTISFNNRPIFDAFGKAPELEGQTTTALGAGLSIDIRPTVAVIAEAIQRTSGLLEAHRPSFMFGIQKKVFRHSFTLGVTNSPGTTLAQRSGTRAALGRAILTGNNLDDTFRGLTMGFNLSRRLF